MRNYFCMLITCLITQLLPAQSDSVQKERQFGVVTTTSLTNYQSLFTTGILATYRINKHQLEFGPKIFLFDRDYYDRQLGTEFNYRYYPNTVHNRFNLFFLFNTDYINVYKISNYQQYIYDSNQYVNVNQKSNQNNIALNAGYGFHVNLFKGLYIGNNVGAGIILENNKVVRNSEEPSINSTRRYKNVDLSFLLTVSLGYRF